MQMMPPNMIPPNMMPPNMMPPNMMSPNMYIPFPQGMPPMMNVQGMPTQNNP